MLEAALQKMQKCAVKGFKTFLVNLCKMDQGMEPCVCNYHAKRAYEQRRHLQTCKVWRDHTIAVLTAENATLREQIIELRTELRLVKASKQREPSNKRAREVHDLSTVNPFGKETIDHISDEKLQELIQAPSTAVAKLVKLKHSLPENQNVRVPNCREATIEVVVNEGGTNTWKRTPKDDILEQLFDQSQVLENEADENDGGAGAAFVRHQERVKKSQDENGKLWREQTKQLWNVLIEMGRV